MTDQFPIEQADLLELLPHRAPFLFVDRVTKLVPGKSIEAERQLRPEEPYFAGHFPGHALMPGVLVTEALAQTSGLLLGLTKKLSATEAPPGNQKFFLAVTNVKFTNPAAPGDLLVLRASGAQSFGGLFKFQVEAMVGRRVIATGSLTLTVALAQGEA